MFTKIFGNKRKKFLKKIGRDSDQEKRVQKINEYIFSELDLFGVATKHKINEDTITAIYDKLILNGGGQWTNGYHVAVSSLCYPETLNILLESFNGKGFSYEGLDDYNSQLKITFDLCEYFDRK